MRLYIHVPFCKKKCRYCAFYSYDCYNHYTKAQNCDSHPLLSLEIYSLWKETLLREIEIISQILNPQDKKIESIFFGGGTPSLIPSEDMYTILNSITQKFSLAPHAEISLEANPDSVNIKNSLAYKDMGFNRISLGVQSLKEKNLTFMGRVHSKQEALQAFDTLRQANFNNISLDFIWGLPHQELCHWHDDLKEAIHLSPEHISCYGLSIEEGSIFEQWLADNTLELSDENLQASMYQETIESLALAGYAQYEISNFARKGYECQHNLGYWRGDNYLGLGPAASGTFKGVRRTHCADIKLWAQDIESGAYEKSFLSMNIPVQKTSSINYKDNPMTNISSDAISARDNASLSTNDFASIHINTYNDINIKDRDIKDSVPSDVHSNTHKNAFYINDNKYSFTLEKLNIQDNILELVMLRMRTTKGLAFADYNGLTQKESLNDSSHGSSNIFLSDHNELVNALEQAKLVTLSKTHIAFTTSGMLVSNAILERFFENIDTLYSNS